MTSNTSDVAMSITMPTEWFHVSSVQTFKVIETDRTGTMSIWVTPGWYKRTTSPEGIISLLSYAQMETVALQSLVGLLWIGGWTMIVNEFDEYPHYNCYPYSFDWRMNRKQHIVYQTAQALSRDRIPDPPFSEQDYYQ